MAVVIEANYSKKLGLPAYSSHAYSITIRSEVADLSQVERESAKLYAILQGSVDREIQEVGFIPEGNGSTPRTTNGHTTNGEAWECSDKQRDLILKIVDEHMTEREAAAYLKVSVRTMIDWRNQGLLPYVRIGRSI
jgi:excisionase family DNA binding protein